MDESAKKGLELNCRDAEIRESRISRIAVEGYDTSLRMEDVDEALRKHFASCGKIIHVYVPVDVKSGILCRYALVYVNEDDEVKALGLNGSDMGGWILQVNPYPFHQNHLEEFLAPMKEVPLSRPQHTMLVTGCDTSLPIDVIKTQLDKYFSAKGSFVYRDVTPSGAIQRLADVYVRGQEGVEKALERSGLSVEGLNFVVTLVAPLPKNPRKIGYMHPHNLTLLTKEQIEDPNIYYVYPKTEKKKKSKTTERNQKKKKQKQERKSTRPERGIRRRRVRLETEITR